MLGKDGPLGGSGLAVSRRWLQQALLKGGLARQILDPQARLLLEPIGQYPAVAPNVRLGQVLEAEEHEVPSARRSWQGVHSVLMYNGDTIIIAFARMHWERHDAAIHLAARSVGYMRGDIVLTRDELNGLMDDLLVTSGPATGPTRLSDWLRQNADTLCRRYFSEMAKHYR